jgi:hypothetical protein
VGGAQGPIDPAKLDSAVRMTREAGAWVVPTMALWEVLYVTLPLDELTAYPELRYVSPQSVQAWVNAYNQRRGAAEYDVETSRRIIEARQQVLAALHRGGAGILMGTDAPQQFSVPG